MTRKKDIKEMLRAVKRGRSFTIYGKDGEPVALVLPWQDWKTISRELMGLTR